VTTLALLWGSVVHRPYVYGFLMCFLVFATYHMGVRRMLTFMLSTYLITYACEYSSTRNGFPFGPYTYFDDMRTQELWISNVPFWDSLSFVFLSYFSFVMAAAVLGGVSRLQSRRVPWVGGAIMMLLDVVIDPVALQGDKWFLGRIYNYPYEGFYFGVTAANFAGWFFVGFTTQWIFQKLLLHAPWCKSSWRTPSPLFIWAIYGVYAGIFIFNLVITIMIKDYRLAQASAFVSGATLLVLALLLKRRDSDCSNKVTACAF
jgi:uncharacterized membrane protein